jgi:hypothetical protein
MVAVVVICVGLLGIATCSHGVVHQHTAPALARAIEAAVPMHSNRRTGARRESPDGDDVGGGRAVIGDVALRRDRNDLTPQMPRLRWWRTVR